MLDNPDWPNQALLEHRRQDAIAADPDEADVLAQCAGAPVTEAPALLRCAAALAIVPGMGHVYLGHNLTVRGIPQFLKASYTDLTPFVAGDAIKDYPNLAGFPTSAWAQVTYDGAIYGVPVVRGAFNNIAYLNTGMFSAVGADVPKNATILKMEVDSDNGTIVTIRFRSKK